MHCIAYRYRIVTAQLLDTDTPFQVYFTALLFSLTGVVWNTAVHTMHTSWTLLCPPLCTITAQGIGQWFPYVCNRNHPYFPYRLD